MCQSVLSPITRAYPYSDMPAVQSMTDNPPYLRIIGAADGKYVVALMEYRDKDDSYYIAKTSKQCGTELQAMGVLVDWARKDGLEIR